MLRSRLDALDAPDAGPGGQRVILASWKPPTSAPMSHRWALPGVGAMAGCGTAPGAGAAAVAVLPDQLICERGRSVATPLCRGLPVAPFDYAAGEAADAIDVAEEPFPGLFGGGFETLDAIEPPVS